MSTSQNPEVDKSDEERELSEEEIRIAFQNHKPTSFPAVRPGFYKPMNVTREDVYEALEQCRMDREAAAKREAEGKS